MRPTLADISGRPFVALLLWSSVWPAAGIAAEATAVPVPANGTRRIVVLGSSTAEGVGASQYGRCWAAQFARAVAPMRFEVVNTSISGTSTGNSIFRFDRDVTPNRPDFVVLATSLWNEGFATNPGPSWNAYIKNTRTLVAMIEAIGAVPVLLGPYPNNASTPQHVAIVKTLYAQLESLGLPLWDMWNGLADENGRWVPGLTIDGTHPLDIGHRYMFDAIPIAAFPAAYTPRGTTARGRAGRGFWSSPRANGEVVVSLLQALESWSVGARVNLASGAAGLTIAVGDDAGVKLARTAGEFELYIGDQLYTAVSFTPNPLELWTDVLLSYRAASNQLALYVNGTELAASTIWSLPSAPQALWRSGCAQCAFSNLTVYRVGFGGDEAAALRAGGVPQKSLEFWTTLTTPAAAVNGAASATTALMRGDWVFSWYIAPPARAQVLDRRLPHSATPH